MESQYCTCYSNKLRTVFVVEFPTCTYFFKVSNLGGYDGYTLPPMIFSNVIDSPYNEGFIFVELSSSWPINEVVEMVVWSYKMRDEIRSLFYEHDDYLRSKAKALETGKPEVTAS